MCVLVGFSIGRFMGPSYLETKKTEVSSTKTAQSAQEDKHERVETRETTRPDGTRVVETVRDTDTRSKTSSEASSLSKKEESLVSRSQSQWSVGLYTNKEVVAGTVDRRIIGGLFLGIYGRSSIPLAQPELGLGLRLEF